MLEKKVCPQCKMLITNKDATRCPRCFKILAQHATCNGCGKCSTGH